VSISHAQREEWLGLNYVATVHNSVYVNSHKFFPTPESPAYLAFLGRISPEKGSHHAIAIAKATGIPLKMAGKVDLVDVAYFEREIKPQIDGKFIQFLGEVDHSMKNNLMGRAIATLYPITWKEPFGLVMIESMAAGTPIIAMKQGAVPEVVAHGKSGFVCTTIEECIAAVDQIPLLSRTACREYVAARFSLEKMTAGYESVYQQVLAEQSRKSYV
jgi:glycosyltransferase involved in cell wall biosynthesis